MRKLCRAALDPIWTRRTIRSRWPWWRSGVRRAPCARVCFRRPAVDPERLAAAGIRQLQGQHITIYTDLPSAPAIDELPRVFDAAVPLWCEYFRLPPRNAQQWQMRGCIMQRHERFLATGLLPRDLPEFLHGYALGGQLWLLEQPSDYYRRHLLLHEGTHAFMQAQLHGMGPPWFAEGLAELLATHRWQDGLLQLHAFPADKELVPHWGRIKLVRDEYAAGRSMSLEQIAEYGPTAHLQNAPYGWSWAAGAFLDGHPDYSERFRRLPRRADQPAREFAQLYRQLFRNDLRQRDEQWQLFVFHLEYGYDLARGDQLYARPHGTWGHQRRDDPSRPRLAIQRCASDGRNDLSLDRFGSLPDR